MIRLSFIVPFYNTEPYIEECIRSLYNQDIPKEEYEVICVDDCSPDSSRAIVERLQKEYPTLKLLIHTENKRQGGARNTGLKEAKGEYVWFVDADDYIKPNYLKDLLKLAEKNNLDVLKFYFDSENKKEDMLASKGVVSGSSLIFDVQTNIPLLKRCCSAVQQIIKREFLLGNNITFAEKVQYEDDDYAYQLYAYAERARLVAVVPYVVRHTPHSTTRRKNDIHRVKDIYAQALRMVQIEHDLALHDARWQIMTRGCIRDCFDNNIFVILKVCTIGEQICFWNGIRTDITRFKPSLSRKSYIKLCSYIMWRILQK